MVNIIAYHRKETYAYAISKNDIMCFATFTVHAGPTECTEMEKSLVWDRYKCMAGFIQTPTILT